MNNTEITTNTESEVIKPKHGGKRDGAGRKKGTTVVKAEKKIIQEGVCLSAEDWQYMEKWFPGGNASQQVRELVERARKFWPNGPMTNPRMNKEQLKKYGGD